MNMETRIVFLSIIIMAAGMWATPLFSRRGIFFGVTIDPEFRITGDARRIVSRFRLAVIALAAISIAALWIVAPHLSGLQWPIATVILIIMQFLAGAGAMAVANRQTRAVIRMTRRFSSRNGSGSAGHSTTRTNGPGYVPL